MKRPKRFKTQKYMSVRVVLLFVLTLFCLGACTSPVKNRLSLNDAHKILLGKKNPDDSLSFGDCRRQLSRDTKVGKLGITLRCQQNVTALDIAMDLLERMQVLKTHQCHFAVCVKQKNRSRTSEPKQQSIVQRRQNRKQQTDHTQAISGSSRA